MKTYQDKRKGCPYEQAMDRVIARGACDCTWDVVDAEGVDHGRDVIVRADPHCPLHRLLALHGENGPDSRDAS